MKIYVAKNNEFKTEGFTVTTNDGERIIFSWGVSAVNNPFFYVKQISDAGNEERIMELVRLQAKANALHDFVGEWFKVATANGYDVSKGANFELIDNKGKDIAAEIERRIEAIING